jgi:methionyl-tRNA formyltransferase
MLIDKTLDTGPILKQASLKLANDETAESLGVKLSELGAKILPDTLYDYLSGRIQPQPQNNELANYVGRLEKKDGIIDWTKSATEIERFSRAMFPWPSAWTWLTGKQLKILTVDQTTIAINTYKPGKTFIYNSNLAVQCGQDSLIIRRLQLEGKKAMTAEEYMNGYKDFVGTVLG